MKNVFICFLLFQVTFSQLKLFEKHKFESHGETYCSCCDRNFDDFEKYFQHLKHVCVICQKRFKSNDSFACHLRNFHSNKPRKKLKSEEESEENFNCGLCQAESMSCACAIKI